MSRCVNYAKLSKRCQMSKSQTVGQEGGAQKNDTIRFTHNDTNFDITCQGHQKCLKVYFMDILRIFDDHIQINHSYHF